MFADVPAEPRHRSCFLIFLLYIFLHGMQIDSILNVSDIYNVHNSEWSLCEGRCSEDIVLCKNNRTACFFVDPCVGSTGTAGVRGSCGFTEGEHYWEVKLLEAAYGSSVQIGVATALADLQSSDYIDLIGKDNQSWGLSYKGTTHHDGKTSKNYCKPFYKAGTIVGVHLDLYIGTLSFSINHQSMGIAFRGLNRVGVPIYPMLSATSAEMEMCVGVRYVRHFSLSERCNLVIARSLSSSTDVQRLPLPELLIHELGKL